jgi:hypothetical protein
MDRASDTRLNSGCRVGWFFVEGIAPHPGVGFLCALHIGHCWLVCLNSVTEGVVGSESEVFDSDLGIRFSKRHSYRPIRTILRMILSMRLFRISRDHIQMWMRFLSTQSSSFRR